MGKLKLDSIPSDPLYIMARYVGISVPHARRLVELNRFVASMSPVEGGG